MKTKDETYEMIMSVYKRDVPLQSEIANPFSANKRQRRKTLTPKTPNVLPEDISTWNSRNFVDYFAEEYYKFFSGFYKKTYSSDCSCVNQIFEFMKANDMDRNENTKKFIDWCFTNSQIITVKNGVFLLSTIKNHLNGYFQQAVLDTREKSIQIDIFEDVSRLCQDNDAKTVLSTYGIPIAATFYIKQKKVSINNFKSAILQLFKTMSKGNSEKKQFVETIIQKSINKGPYVEGFELLDWREEYKEFLEPYKNELWYRDKDYPGKPQYDFGKFLN